MHPRRAGEHGLLRPVGDRANQRRVIKSEGHSGPKTSPERSVSATIPIGWDSEHALPARNLRRGDPQPARL
ncbi:hypothetical protein GCM10010344_60460 [Streptomyces bluensis]|nr:hypothetical protein GCM10010344_60460 [Streptomyces bluensis]